MIESDYYNVNEWSQKVGQDNVDFVIRMLGITYEICWTVNRNFTSYYYGTEEPTREMAVGIYNLVTNLEP